MKTKSEAIAYLRELLKDEQLSLSLIKEKFTQGFVHALEWNLTEEAAVTEYKIGLITNFIVRLQGPAVEESHQADVEESRRMIEQELLGSSHLSSEQGPWDEHSTSYGFNRLAIVKANLKRYFYHLQQKVAAGYDLSGKEGAEGYSPKTEMNTKEKEKTMSAENLENLLAGALEMVDDELTKELGVSPIKDVQTFSSAGLMTNDKGLVVATENGSEFQISIVRSR